MGKQRQNTQKDKQVEIFLITDTYNAYRKDFARYFTSQVEYYELPNLGHYVDLEDPGEFVKYVRDFLDKDQ